MVSSSDLTLSILGVIKIWGNYTREQQGKFCILLPSDVLALPQSALRKCADLLLSQNGRLSRDVRTEDGLVKPSR